MSKEKEGPLGSSSGAGSSKTCAFFFLPFTLHASPSFASLAPLALLSAGDLTFAALALGFLAGEAKSAPVTSIKMLSEEVAGNVSDCAAVLAEAAATSVSAAFALPLPLPLHHAHLR